MSTQHLSSQHLSISGISQLLLTRFWWNFAGRFLGTSIKDFNCQVDICPGNICPGNFFPGHICPHQEYLSYYWPDVDKTLNVNFFDHLLQRSTIMMTFVYATYVLATFVHINISVVIDPILTKLEDVVWQLKLLLEVGGGGEKYVTPH